MALCNGCSLPRGDISKKNSTPSSLDPRLSPSTLIFLYILWSIYKIRETISGQCWLTVCDAGLTLAERLVYISGRGTIRNICLYIICGHFIRSIFHKHETVTQCWLNGGPPFTTSAQHYPSIGSACRGCWGSSSL